MRRDGRAGLLTHYRPTHTENISCQQYEHITLSAIPQETESGSETVVDGRAGLLTHYRLGTPHREYLLSTYEHITLSAIPETESGSETVADGRAGLLTTTGLAHHTENISVNSMSISPISNNKKLRVAYEHITLSAIPQETESGSETVADGRAGLLTHYRPDTPYREYLLSKTRAYHSISNTTRTASGSETVADGRAHYRLGTPHREILSTVGTCHSISNTTVT
ncbi:hypothetical protein J6590_013561 [Homalodisca vitripennis]|nr:hypothetical protein J6590_013561 [Homalodisca vitripennis]